MSVFLKHFFMCCESISYYIFIPVGKFVLLDLTCPNNLVAMCRHSRAPGEQLHSSSQKTALVKGNFILQYSRMQIVM